MNLAEFMKCLQLFCARLENQREDIAEYDHRRDSRRGGGHAAGQNPERAHLVDGRFDAGGKAVPEPGQRDGRACAAELDDFVIDADCPSE